MSAIAGSSLERPCRFIVARGAGTAGKLTRASDESNPYDGRQQIPCRSRPGRGTAQIVVQKMQVVVQKMQVKPSFSFKPYVSNRRPMGDGCLQSSASKCRRGSIKKMRPVPRKAGIGVRYRNLWNGHWWAHTRFCSAHCMERYTSNAKHHWYAFVSAAARRADFFAHLLSPRRSAMQQGRTLP